jgi:hypothetical protein
VPTTKRRHPSRSLPKSLEPVHIRRAVEYVEQRAAEVVELYYEQANVFSAIVGIFGTQALDSFSPYKKHKHPDVAQQRFPDLSLAGRLNPPPPEALESKASIRPWAVQSHFDHPGWYIIWRYLVDPTKSVKPGREVVVWRVDVVFLDKGDWKYEGSDASAAGGGRTHTFGLREAAKRLKDAAAYVLPGVVLKGGRPVLAADSN